MFESLKQRMHRFLAEPSGRRFRARYARRRSQDGPLQRALAIGAGLILIAGGIVLLVLPGPGLLGIALGAVLIAGQSKWAAVLLDRVDLFVSRRRARWRARGR